MSPWTPREVGRLLLGVLVAVVFLGALAYVGGAGQRDLAARVDVNAAISRQRSEDLLTQTVRHRYVTDCMFFTPPAPERVVDDLLTCVNEAQELDWTDAERIGSVLARNLRDRGVE